MNNLGENLVAMPPTRQEQQEQQVGVIRMFSTEA